MSDNYADGLRCQRVQYIANLIKIAEWLGELRAGDMEHAWAFFEKEARKAVSEYCKDAIEDR